MNVNGMNYLGVISASQLVGVLVQAKINKVVQVKMIPFKVSCVVLTKLCRINTLLTTSLET